MVNYQDQKRPPGKVYNRVVNKKQSSIPFWLIGASALIFAIANIVSYFGKCTYDDVLNLWSCTSTSTASLMGLFDVVIFCVACPLLFAGLAWLIIKVFSN